MESLQAPTYNRTRQIRGVTFYRYVRSVVSTRNVPQHGVKMTFLGAVGQYIVLYPLFVAMLRLNTMAARARPDREGTLTCWVPKNCLGPQFGTFQHAGI